MSGDKQTPSYTHDNPVIILLENRQTRQNIIIFVLHPAMTNGNTPEERITLNFVMHPTNEKPIHNDNTCVEDIKVDSAPSKHLHTHYLSTNINLPEKAVFADFSFGFSTRKYLLGSHLKS